MIVNQRNPKALEAKRIKNTTTVVVLFDGMKVPNYVMCGVSLLRCTLYKRQNDVCYACGGLGHRADVCPNHNKRVCRGLWARLPIRRSPVLAKMCPLRRTASHGGQNVQRTLSSSLHRATEKTTAPKARQKDSAAGPGEPVTGFQRFKYSQAGGVPSRQLAAGAAAPGAALAPGGGSRKSLPGRIVPSRSQRRRHESTANDEAYQQKAAEVATAKLWPSLSFISQAPYHHEVTKAAAAKQWRSLSVDAQEPYQRKAAEAATAKLRRSRSDDAQEPS
ncbi:hypothetical protein MTO96_020972 [Rhipicephalus appendiculatus]